MRPIYKILYRFCPILIVLLGHISFGQNFLDKDFYLIDSIKATDFENGEIEMLDSVLTIYHKSDEEVIKLEIQDKIIESLQNSLCVLNDL